MNDQNNAEELEQDLQDVRDKRGDGHARSLYRMFVSHWNRSYENIFLPEGLIFASCGRKANKILVYLSSLSASVDEGASFLEE